MSSRVRSDKLVLVGRRLSDSRPWAPSHDYRTIQFTAEPKSLLEIQTEKSSAAPTGAYGQAGPAARWAQHNIITADSASVLGYQHVQTELPVYLQMLRGLACVDVSRPQRVFASASIWLHPCV